MPKGKKDPNKPRGRMPAYSFFVQACREERRRNSPEEELNFLQFSRFCAGRWKVLPELVKGEFQEMARRDAMRYQQEMEGYVPPRPQLPPTPPNVKKEEELGPPLSPPKVKDKKVKKRRTKDPNAPSRPLSAFFWFCHEERPKLRERDPDRRLMEVAKELAQLWAGMDPKSKQRFQEIATRDKARYNLELFEYKKKNLAAGFIAVT